MSVEDARAYSDQCYPPTAGDIIFEFGLRSGRGPWSAARGAARYVRRLRHLMKELSAAPPLVPRTGETLTAFFDELHGNVRRQNDALEEFAALLAPLKGIASALEHQGYTGAAGKAKQIDLYGVLFWGGAGAAAATAALYDADLLALLLKTEADGANARDLVITTFGYLDGKTSSRRGDPTWVHHLRTRRPT